MSRFYGDRPRWTRPYLQQAANHEAREAVDAMRFEREYRFSNEPTCPECGKTLAREDMRYPVPACPCEEDRFAEVFDRCIAEKRANVIADTLNLAGLPRRLADRTLDNFEAREGTQGALNLCRGFVERFDRDRGDGLWLIGPYGVGKTHLAIGSAKAINDKDLTDFLFTSASDLIVGVRPEPGSRAFRWESLDAAIDAELLILDDVGQEQPSEFTRDVLYRVIDGRHAAERPLILTSNLGDAELEERLGGAAVSRLYEMTSAVLIEASDYRAEIARRRNLKSA